MLSASALWYYPLDKVFHPRVGALVLWNYGQPYELMPFPETLFVTEGGPRPSTRVCPLLSVSALWYHRPDKVLSSRPGAPVLWNYGQSYEPMLFPETLFVTEGGPRPSTRVCPLLSVSALWYYPPDKVLSSRIGALVLWNYGQSYELMLFPETLFVTEGDPRPSTRVCPLLSVSALWYYPPAKVFPSRVGALVLWNYGHSYELMPFSETLFVTEGGPRPSTRVCPLLSASALWYYRHDKVFSSRLGALVLRNYGQPYELMPFPETLFVTEGGPRPSTRVCPLLSASALWYYRHDKVLSSRLGALVLWNYGQSYEPMLFPETLFVTEGGPRPSTRVCPLLSASALWY